MVAVAIFASMAVTLSLVSSQSSVNAMRLEQKTFASWVAQNQLIEIRNSALPEPTELKSDAKMANRDWKIVTKIQAVDFEVIGKDLRRVEIEVYTADDENRPVHTLTSLIGRN